MDHSRSPLALAASGTVSLFSPVFIVLAVIALVALIVVAALVDLQLAHLAASHAHGLLASSNPPTVPCPGGSGSSCLGG